jgi:hypothetical protein
MKRLFFSLLALIGLITLSCEQNECEQEAMCTKISETTKEFKAAEPVMPDACPVEWYDFICSKEDEPVKVTICHNGNTLCLPWQDAWNHLQTHIDDSIGECQTLGIDGLQFKNGEVVKIACKYELPFIHIDKNGTHWFYDTSENNSFNRTGTDPIASAHYLCGGWGYKVYHFHYSNGTHAFRLYKDGVWTTISKAEMEVWCS